MSFWICHDGAQSPWRGRRCAYDFYAHRGQLGHCPAHIGDSEAEAHLPARSVRFARGIDFKNTARAFAREMFRAGTVTMPAEVQPQAGIKGDETRGVMRAQDEEI